MSRQTAEEQLKQGITDNSGIQILIAIIQMLFSGEKGMDGPSGIMGMMSRITEEVKEGQDVAQNEPEQDGPEQGDPSPAGGRSEDPEVEMPEGRQPENESETLLAEGQEGDDPEANELAAAGWNFAGGDDLSSDASEEAQVLDNQSPTVGLKGLGVA